MKYLGLKLGPALKLCYHIDKLKQTKFWHALGQNHPNPHHSYTHTHLSTHAYLPPTNTYTQTQTYMVSHNETDYFTISRCDFLCFRLCSSYAFLTLTYQVPVNFLNICDYFGLDTNWQFPWACFNMGWERDEPPMVKVIAGTSTELLELCILKIDKDKKI